MSHPAWVCGLKLNDVRINRISNVTPCVGVWIETTLAFFNSSTNIVTPCVGVWIETKSKDSDFIDIMSHPAWVCGLKQWLGKKLYLTGNSHTLRGCVD